MTRLAQLIAQMEGFGIPDAIPTLRNNPGDLRHSPNSSHPPGDPDGIGYIDTVEHGWEDLDRQLTLYAERGLTLQQAIEEFAPPTENNTANYLSFVADGLQMPVTASMTDAITLDAIAAA